ncbi:MAG: hypothetical protein CMP33_05105 [Rickettsiales bacterium]|nr:hypothetical protein [Rickettsiales bacterium]
MAKATIQERVLNSLANGSKLTTADIKNKFGAGNPQAVVQALRFAGYPVFLNTRKNSRGTAVSRYVMGTKASRAVIGAGYKAIAKGLLDN